MAKPLNSSRPKLKQTIISVLLSSVSVLLTIIIWGAMEIISELEGTGQGELVMAWFTGPVGRMTITWLLIALVAFPWILLGMQGTIKYISALRDVERSRASGEIRRAYLQALRESPLNPSTDLSARE